MNRRRVLKLLGGAVGMGVVGRYTLLPPPYSRRLDTPHQLALRFFESLDGKDRERACVDYDHPLRQYHNRGVWGGGLSMNPVNLNWEQRRIATDLLHAGLSEVGRQRVPKEYFTYWPGVHSMQVLICGNPKTPPYQLILTGAHLNLRLGGQSREGAAFGGPMVYGDQRGNTAPGLPGNLYRFQFQMARQLFRSLSSDQQRLALKKNSPVQTAIQLQGSQGSFEGVETAGLSRENRRTVRELIDGILSTYPPEDVAYAWQCLEHNGGPERLFLSYYADSTAGQSGQYQNFRLEGPAAVFYFRGYPHVHAFINVAMNGDRPLSVGEVLADNPRALEGVEVKQLFEAAMQAQLGTDFAYYDVEAVAGRLQKGPIRTGDIYALESWQDSVATLEVKGSQLSATLLDQLRRHGAEANPRRTYTVATTGYIASREAEKLGRVESRNKSGMVRDVTIAYLRKRGFPTPA